ncbi:hypothetical protein HXX76_002426 [Chlamydomonas incerta]|uniref:Protein kinase domain-containing protein n=1 Tax=Chlamydomonas incerta TaxID=51695 RepID=A0A835TQP0_CHLIN|nr:hypothetical protein HXX76_002426 [Chlamydomonas incerta]|eukprot:KAG2442340.1 hypothetical protein HXX76_002426 [Chlamydomonas incerta]
MPSRKDIESASMLPEASAISAPSPPALMPLVSGNMEADSTCGLQGVRPQLPAAVQVPPTSPVECCAFLKGTYEEALHPGMAPRMTRNVLELNCTATAAEEVESLVAAPPPATPADMDPCAVLRQAVMEQHPGLGAPWIVKEEQVLACDVVTEAGGGAGGGPARTVYQMEVALEGGHVMAVAGKGFKVVLTEADDAGLASGELVVPASFEAALQEPLALAAVARRFRRVHGEEALGRCFPEVFGWDLLQPAPGTYEFEWLDGGNAFAYLKEVMTTTARSADDMYVTVLDAACEMVRLVDAANMAGLSFGDLKAQNMLVDAQGTLKLNDVEGVSLAGLGDLSAAHTAAHAAAAAAAASCIDDARGARTAAKTAAAPVWEAQALQRAPLEPYMVTDIYAPPEFWVSWARQALEQGEAVGSAYQWDVYKLREEAVEQPCWPGAVMLLDRLQRECPTRDDALRLLQGMGGGCGCSYMCGASHTYLLGASISHLLVVVAAELSQRQGEESEQRLAFVSELHGVMARLMTGEPASRPSLRVLRRWLAELRADWCSFC